MAKTNKYTSINFNHIYDKNLPTNSNPNNPIKTSSSSSSSSSASSASFSYSAVSSANKSHGRMLVLTRPSPKPISIPSPVSSQPQPPRQTQQNQVTDRGGRSDPGSDAISLRPLGRTGAGSSVLSPVLSQEKDKDFPVPVVSPKPDKFVPPHLRPGFVGREERPGPEVTRTREVGQKHVGSPVMYGEDGRPKSGGGYERMTRGGELDLGTATRPNSSGNRPNSSGW
ncbi:hypothetical protein FNV43_RR13744 [Rhamnella rubrinervis]|uniref:Uncharacterized protein n=1 Tax=Rhamnella rubrinervis TaxID=2594499 RepID=A0A8K0H1Q2_9ROSA|nr:hypothetical protein FNV43_RR13744 [Rhamnella rubrinervis]